MYKFNLFEDPIELINVSKINLYWQTVGKKITAVGEALNLVYITFSTKRSSSLKLQLSVDTPTINTILENYALLLKLKYMKVEEMSMY